MARSPRFVTSSKQREAPLPAWASTFDSLCRYLLPSDILKKISNFMRFSYKRGYPMIDLLLFFLLMAVGYHTGGISGFRKQIKPCALRLAAMAMRAKLLTASSISRALQAAERIDDLNGKTAWLLSEGASVCELACSPLVQTRDAHGDYWTPLDFDPSVKVFRNRALPTCEELPEAVRLSADLCVPGYPGRHRGQKQMSTAILSHTGAGIFLQGVTYAGNAPFAEALATAAIAAAGFVDSCKISRSRTIIRFDGAGGFGAAIAGVGKQGLHYLTRLRHYSVFSDPLALVLMKTGVWFDVIDSGSGPKRQAMELGRWWLDDGEGGGFWARLVESRFVNSDGKKHGAGIVHEGWQYEAYATDIASDCFPAPDAVSLYYSRCGQENMFGRSVQSLRLNEMFSHDLKGQQLATAMMMWGHNLMVSRAAADAGDLGTPPAQTPRPTEQIALTAAAVAAQAEAQEEPEAEPTAQIIDMQAEVAEEPEVPEVTDQELVAEPTDAGADFAEEILESVAAVSTEVPVIPKGTAPTHYVCPQGFAVRLHNVRQLGKTKMYGVYRAPGSACGNCPKRTLCSTSTKPVFRKEFMVHIDGLSIADWNAARALAQTCGADHADAVVFRPGPAAAKEQKKPAKMPREPSPAAPKQARPVIAQSRYRTPLRKTAGPMLVAGPCLMLAVLLRAWAEEQARFVIEVKLKPTKMVKKNQPWIAASDAERQRRRQTWAQRSGKNHYPGLVEVKRSPVRAERVAG